MKLLIYILFSLFSLSVFANEIRLIHKQDGSVIYVTTEYVGQYTDGNNEYEIEKPISPPSPQVEVVDLKSNQAFEQSERSINIFARASSLVASGENITAPTDPSFYLQYFWSAPTSSYYAHSNIKATHGTVTPYRKPRIGIIDSGFWNNSDLTFSEGYSFVDISSKGLSPNANWAMTGSTQSYRESCGYSHGTGVASVIGAKTNNGVGIAGIVDAELIAGKAMECNTGYFSNAISTMDWMGGDTVGSAPNISSPVDVINMSLGGIGECKAYMQAAVDRARARGILVFVSAGNDSVDASTHYPSNCEGVITSAALTRSGGLASFSNYGSTNDVGTLGDVVYALGPADGAVYGWNGTSFASPISAGIAARTIVRYPNVSANAIEALLLQSTSDFNPSLNCSTKGCGVGVTNATNLDNIAKSYDEGKIFSFKSALADMPFCDKTKYFTFSGDKERLCALTKVTFIDDAHYDANDTYELYKVPTGNKLTASNGVLIMSTNDKEALAPSTDIDFASYDYGFRTCTSGTCKLEKLIPANLAYLNAPTECD